MRAGGSEASTGERDFASALAGVRSRPKCARQAREHTSARSGRWDPRTRLGRASEVGPDEYWPWAVGCAHAPAGHTAGGSLGTCGSGEEQLTEQWRTFRSLPSRSQTGLACIHVSSHSACEPPSCACIAPPSYPSSLIVSANPCTTGTHEAAEASETLLWSRTNWGRARGGCSSSGSRRTAAAAAGPAGAVGIEERLAGDT